MRLSQNIPDMHRSFCNRLILLEFSGTLPLVLQMDSAMDLVQKLASALAGLTLVVQLGWKVW